jgi:hypothetical protein
LFFFALGQPRILGGPKEFFGGGGGGGGGVGELENP